MRLFTLALPLVSTLAMACAATTDVDVEDDGATEAESAITSRRPDYKAYGQAPGWSAKCDGSSITQADLSEMLGSRRARVLGRFDVATRDFCSPWVNGAGSCGPSGETKEAFTGDAKFAFGLPMNNPRFSAWRFANGPLLVHDTGLVVARKLGLRIVVQLVGDLSSVEIGNERTIDGTVTGLTRLRGRLLSSDLVRDGGETAPPRYNATLRMVAAPEGQRVDAASVDVETLRYTSPPEPIANVGVFSRVYGRDRWGDGSSMMLTGTVTRSCLRLSDGMNPNGVVVTSTFTAP